MPAQDFCDFLMCFAFILTSMVWSKIHPEWSGRVPGASQTFIQIKSRLFSIFFRIMPTAATNALCLVLNSKIPNRVSELR